MTKPQKGSVEWAIQQISKALLIGLEGLSTRIIDTEQAITRTDSAVKLLVEQHNARLQAEQHSAAQARQFRRELSVAQEQIEVLQRRMVLTEVADSHVFPCSCEDASKHIGKGYCLNMVAIEGGLCDVCAVEGIEPETEPPIVIEMRQADDSPDPWRATYVPVDSNVTMEGGKNYVFKFPPYPTQVP